MIIASTLEIVLIIIFVVTLGLVSYKLQILDTGGAIASMIMGMIIGILGSIYWLLLLIIFLAISYLATKYEYALKSKKGVAEGRVGERGYQSVIANGLVPMLIVFVPIALPQASLLYITGLSAATADTVASEFGVISKNTHLITTFKRVVPGTNGGISLRGELWAILGASIVSIIAYTVFVSAKIWSVENYHNILIPIIIGFVGCQVDSVLGATLENKKLLTKGGVNILQISISTILAYFIIAGIW